MWASSQVGEHFHVVTVNKIGIVSIAIISGKRILSTLMYISPHSLEDFIHWRMLEVVM